MDGFGLAILASSCERLSGFALTDQPLPRTRLGKYRRFLLPSLYAQAVAGAGRRAVQTLSEEDAVLLRDPTAGAVWTLLQQRYPEQAIDLDINLSLDLSLASFAWMELTILLQDRLGIHFSDTDIAEIATIRDLLRLSIERQTGTPPLPQEPPAFALDIERWLAPTSALLTALGFMLYALNRLLMRGVFRVRFTGLNTLPETGPFVITPNHVSYLDGPAIAAALPWRRLRQPYWAGDVLRLFSNPLFASVLPCDAPIPGRLEPPWRSTGNRDASSDGRQCFGRVPEGRRSPDGSLQCLLPGIGQLLVRSGAPAVPTYIAGAFEAWPRERRLPRFHRITVTFGHPETVASLCARGSGQTDEERVADALRQSLVALGAEASRAAGPIAVAGHAADPVVSTHQ